MSFKRPVSLALLITAAGTGGCLAPDTEQERLAEQRSAIVGGKPVEIAEAPWQVSLQTTASRHFCGGSILSEEWVVTAQHCVRSSSSSSLKVVAGVSKLSDSENRQERAVAEIVLFPGYTSTSKGKDIALLRLAEKLDLSTDRAKAIAYAKDSETDLAAVAPGTMSLVTGWGRLKSGGSGLPDDLQQVDVPVITNEEAAAAYAREITEDQLAAGYMGVGEKDACQGDSGGPLVVPHPSGSGFLLAGLVSWGIGCAEPKYPGMYGRVSSFSKWIAEHIENAPPPEEVKVHFTCAEGHTVFGQSVYVVGSVPELGTWSPASGIKLEPTNYPNWTGTVSFSKPAEAGAQTVEWKCVKRSEANPTESIEWQAGANNAFVQPSSGELSASGSF